MTRSPRHWTVPQLLSLASLSLLAMTACPAYAMDCFTAAGQYQKVNPLILRAIAWQESRDNIAARHVNTNGSTDYGLMQINSIHLPRLAQYGVSSEKLMNPCASVYVAAWHLRQKMDKYGNSWAAVGAYHSETPTLRDQYARQIIAILRRWNVMPAAEK